ncbi:MAG TPA: hypothetical protein VGF67_19745 [Ktedonobacteraceae bacterium]
MKHVSLALCSILEPDAGHLARPARESCIPALRNKTHDRALFKFWRAGAGVDPGAEENYT